MQPPATCLPATSPETVNTPDAAPDSTAPRIRIAGGFVLDLPGQALRDAAGHVLDLRPQAFDVLRLLAMRRGELVTKEELLAAVWPGLVVTDDSLVQAVGDVRRALGEAGHRLIRTVPRRGYLLTAGEDGATAPQTDIASGTAASKAPRRRTAYATALAVFVAAATTGGVAIWTRGPTRDPSVARMPSIAVLPFKAPTADGEGLARDLAINLVSELARSPDLRVIATQSSFALADIHAPLAEMGSRLRSRYFVDGTVRREGEQLNMVVELLDSEDGRVVWSFTQQVDRNSLAETQRSLVGRIAGSLQVRVSSNEERRVLARPPRNLDVVALTAQGRTLLRRYSPEGIREARRLIEQAVAIDPQYAPAWVALGQVNNVDIGSHLTGEWDRRRSPEVVAQLQRAIALQPDVPMAYLALSETEGVAGHYEASLTASEKCLRLSPNDAGCLYAVGAAQLRLGQVKAAVDHLGQARDRNPAAPAYLAAFYGTALWAARRFDEALGVDDECLTLAPDFHRCRADRIATLVELGRIAQAREEATRLRERVPNISAEDFALGFADAASALSARRVAAARTAGLPANAAVTR